MQTINQDFQAFLAKLKANPAGYEKRSAPDLAGTIAEVTQAVAEFKQQHTRELEAIKTKLARPGAFQPDTKADGSASQLFDEATGKRLIEIRKGDDVAAKYRQAGLLGGDEFRELRFGDFVRAIAGQRTSELGRKALSVGTDASGGHMVPAVLMPGVLEALTATSSLMQAGSRIVPVGEPGEGAKSYTMAAVNAVPTAAWRAEAGAVSESDPSFRAVVATPRSLSFFFKVSRELLNDAANLERVLPTIIGQSFALAMDRAGLIGSGTAPEPRGIRNTVGIQSVTNGAAGASLATTRWGNLMSAAQAILSADGPAPTAAIMHPRTLVGFGSLADTTNQPLQRPDMLRNMQMISTSQLPVNLTVGGSTDCSEIFLGNFERTAFVMRESVSIQRLNELFATNGQVGFLAHARVDFVCEYPATLALVTGVRP